jgi:hypothetical protein
MKVGDLVMQRSKNNPNNYDYKRPDSYNNYYGLVIESCESNEWRFGNERLWYRILWQEGDLSWVEGSDTSLVIINESR